MTALRILGLVGSIGLLFSAGACDSDESDGDDDDGSGGSSSTSGTGGSGGSSSTSSGTGGSGGSSSTSSGTGGSGGAPSGCAPASNSQCGNQGSVVRVSVTLGAGMTAETGNLVVRLFHTYQGGSSTGGGYHHERTLQGVTVDPNTPLQVEIDMCESPGGAMWSESYCDYNLWMFMDLNSNTVLDANEAAGAMTVTVSCQDTESQCYSLELDCTDGMSCAGYDDSSVCNPPGGC